jgi:hypothetical protein
MWPSFSKKNPIKVFLSGWIAVPINPDKRSSTYLFYCSFPLLIPYPFTQTCVCVCVFSDNSIAYLMY